MPTDSVSKQSGKVRGASSYEDPQSSMVQDVDPSSAVFLRTNWQIQGYLQEQADIIEKYATRSPETFRNLLNIILTV